MDELRRDLRAITADGAASSVMVGIGETYLPAFVLAISSSQLASGLVATVPLVAGAVLQLISPWAVRRLRSYRLWVVLCAAVQAAAFVPLGVAAALGAMPVLLVFVVATVYWAAGMATGPAWNAWVETLVPEEMRPRYFARRTRVAQLGLLSGFVGGGLVLQACRVHDPLWGFALLFLAAAAARLVSVRCLAAQGEPLLPVEAPSLPGPRQLLASARRNANFRVLLFMLGMQTAVWVAGPYFLPYMFVHLELSYGGFVLLTCTAFVAKIVALPMFGGAVGRWGAKRVLWVCGLAIAPVPAFWFVVDDFRGLLVLQAISGFAWAGYELAMLLIFFQTIPRQKRVSILTVFNVANATAIVVGSLTGGAVLGWLGPARQTYLVLFAVSSIGRAAALLLLVRMPKFQLVPRRMATRPLSLQPVTGSMDRPIVPSLETTEKRPGSPPRPVAVPVPLANATASRPEAGGRAGASHTLLTAAVLPRAASRQPAPSGKRYPNCSTSAR